MVLRQDGPAAIDAVQPQDCHVLCTHAGVMRRRGRRHAINYSNPQVSGLQTQKCEHMRQRHEQSPSIQFPSIRSAI